MKDIPDLDLASLIIASMFGCDQTFAFYGQGKRVLEGILNMVRIFCLAEGHAATPAVGTWHRTKGGS